MSDQGKEPPKFQVIEGGRKPREIFPVEVRSQKADDLRKHASELLSHKLTYGEYFSIPDWVKMTEKLRETKPGDFNGVPGTLRAESTPERTEYEAIFNHPDGSVEGIILRISTILGGPGVIHYEKSNRGTVPVVLENDEDAYNKIWDVFTDRFENPEASVDKS